MTTKPRFLVPLFALLLVAAPAITIAAEQVRWPLTWKAGDTWVYDTESIDREIEGGKTKAVRTSDRTEIRVDEAAKSGYVQTWTSRDSRIETIEGDRASSDMIAPALEQFDGYGVIAEFGADGRYRRLRNLDDTTTKVRTIMRSLVMPNVDKLFGKTDPKLSKADADAARAEAERNLEAMMEAFFSRDKVEVMTTGQIKTFSDFVGGTFQAGKRYRDAEPLESPLYGKPLPATREYSIAIDKNDPALARLRWTHALNNDGDADALWQLASELGNADLQSKRPAGRPQDLALREEGVAVFRRDTGVIELLQTELTSHYGDAHDEHKRNRMRLVGSRRTWAEEDAATTP
jgi:hypothetical protein